MKKILNILRVIFITIFCCFYLIANSYAIENYQDAKIKEAQTQAQSWLKLMDIQKYEQAYSLLSFVYLDSIKMGDNSNPSKYWIKNISYAREKLGTNISRNFYRITPTGQLKGGRGSSSKGEYIIFDIKSNYSKKNRVIETVSVRYEKGGWKVSSYIFK